MKLLVLVFLHCLASPLLAYRDGARENSCYDHSIDHGAGTETFPCVPPTCPFFLRIREVVDEDTLELGNETDTYQCGRIYGIELANNLNDPEGFLIQARNGTDVSSEIIGTFLDPSDVRARNPTVPLNYKILNCNLSMEYESPLPNSATHPTTVDNAGILQLYWRAPNCSTCGLGDLRIWFTAVQQLQIVFTTSKVTILQLQNYTEPEECIPQPPTTTAPTTAPPTAPTTASPTTTTVTTTDEPGPSPSKSSNLGLIIGVVVGPAVAIAVVVVIFVSVLSYYACKSRPKKPKQLKDDIMDTTDDRHTDKDNALKTDSGNSL